MPENPDRFELYLPRTSNKEFAIILEEMGYRNAYVPPETIERLPDLHDVVEQLADEIEQGLE